MKRVSWKYRKIEDKTYDVPTQLASLDLLKSEEMEGSTVRGRFNERKYFQVILKRTYLLELKSLKKKITY